MLGNSQRRQVQRNIFDVLDQLKQRFAEDLIGADMTLGDEFQIILNTPEKALDIYEFLTNQLKTPFYTGVGIGAIESFTDKKSPKTMYGEAFYQAREAVNEAKKKQIDITFATGNKTLDHELNTITELAIFIQKKWTKRQKTIINYLTNHNTATQKETAKHFKVSETAISKTLKTSGYETVKKAKQLTKTLLAQTEQLITTQR
jgi:prolyl-tRNA editing enzyme YbaK/EbsC (Cys-tRNA(Pro) deacylase)